MIKLANNLIVKSSSAEFLMDSEADLADDFKAIVEDQLTDEAYTEAIIAISNKLVEFIVNNPYLMIEDSHVDSRDYDIDWLDEHPDTLNEFGEWLQKVVSNNNKLKKE